MVPVWSLFIGMTGKLAAALVPFLLLTPCRAITRFHVSLVQGSSCPKTAAGKTASLSSDHRKTAPQFRTKLSFQGLTVRSTDHLQLGSERPQLSVSGSFFFV